jgi:hypothetical protein
MSRNQRLALVVAALAVAVIAFVIVSPGGDDDGNSDSTNAVETAPARNDEQPGGSTAPAQTTPAEPKPAVTRIQIAGGEVEGGVKSIKVTKGDRVRIVISADAPDTLHLHGYDIEKTAEPGTPAVFAFTANLEGVYELESHTAEDAGLEPAVARLAVEPS